jgi:hypothetical protein
MTYDEDDMEKNKIVEETIQFDKDEDQEKIKK